MVRLFVYLIFSNHHSLIGSMEGFPNLDTVNYNEMFLKITHIQTTDKSKRNRHGPNNNENMKGKRNNETINNK